VVPFGDKFVNNSIITKHIVLIYIQFIFLNYQIATSLGYTYQIATSLGYTYQIATSLGYTYRRHKKCQQF
jgi:hypothetical protein